MFIAETFAEEGGQYYGFGIVTLRNGEAKIFRFQLEDWSVANLEILSEFEADLKGLFMSEFKIISKDCLHYFFLIENGVNVFIDASKKESLVIKKPMSFVATYSDSSGTSAYY